MQIAIINDMLKMYITDASNGYEQLPRDRKNIIRVIR